MLVDKKDKFRFFAWIPAGLFLCAAAICIALGIENSRAQWDQNTFHLPTILKFAQELPRPNLADYQSATTPGYHLVMATVAKAIGDDPRVLRLIGALFAAGLLLAMGKILATRVGGVSAMALTMPMAANIYIIASGMSLLPDNAGWLFALLSLACLLRVPFDGKTALIGGAMVFLLFLSRQMHLWVCAPFLMAAWLYAPGSRIKGLVVAMVALLPTLAGFGYFYWLWRGTTPPQFQASHEHMNFAVPAMVLACAALPGAGFASLLWDKRKRLMAGWIWIVAGLAAGLALGLLPETEPNISQGRYSGWWNLAAKMPIYGHRSLLILAMSATGGMFLGAFLAALPRARDAFLFLTVIGAFMLANMVGAMAFQRYFDPMVLMLFPLMAAKAAENPVQGWEWKLVGPLALSGVMAGITVVS